MGAIKLGEKIDIDGIEYVAVNEVVKDGCHGCAFYDASTGTIDLTRCNKTSCAGETIMVEDLKNTSSPLDVQVDGDHYKHGDIQPIEFCEKNSLTASESNAVKYITRHKFKHGLIDIEKVLHYLDFIKLFRNTDKRGDNELAIGVYKYIAANNLGFFEGKVIEQIMLHKTTHLDSHLNSARECVNKIIEMYGETNKIPK